jgi:hypothetical protein
MTLIDMEDRRKSERCRVVKRGSIRFGDHATPCLLRSESPSGVALDIPSLAGIPDQFTLFVLAEKTIHSCTVVWRRDRRIGVAFY